LGRALAVGREYGLVNIWGWHPAASARLCAVALAHGIESEYVRELIRRRGLRPDPASTYLDQWPWPLRVVTLGRFEIRRDDQLLPSRRKAQRRPLTLLKAMIAFGGERVSEDRLAEALWPDAEGDAAQRALATAVHRLRRLLGDDKVIRRQAAQLSLDREVCWVDTWAVERLLAEAERTEGLAELARLGGRVMALYADRFLADETDAPWATPLAARLERRVVSLLGSLGARHEAAGEWSKAAEYQERRLDFDPTVEDATRRLMTAYHRLGRRGDLVAVYRRCCRALEAAGTAPSPETTALFKRLTLE
jgi:DNA-binding SARP family transcriptional activator